MRFKIVLAMLMVVLSGCASMLGYTQKPEVELSGVSLKDADMSGATIVLVFDVENPNERGISVEEIGYKVYVSGKHLTTAKTEDKIDIPAKQKKAIEVPLPIKYKDIFSNIGEILSAGSLQYKIEGDAKFTLISVPFSKEGSLELPKLF